MLLYRTLNLRFPDGFGSIGFLLRCQSYRFPILQGVAVYTARESEHLASEFCDTRGRQESSVQVPSARKHGWAAVTAAVSHSLH